MKKARSTGLASSGPAGALPASPDAHDAQSRIGAQLHQIYEEVLQEPIPQRFLDLLSELDRVDHVHRQRNEE